MLRRLVLAVAVTAVAAVAASTVVVAAPTQVRAGVAPDRLNVVLIVADDMALTDLRHMRSTRRLLRRGGVALTGLSPHPLCCPARAMILTGQYAHNNGVRTNHGPHGGYAALDASSTLATWLDDAGYTTVFLGKFLNYYSREHAADPRPGWDDWNATIGGAGRSVYNYRDFVVNHNGVLVEHQAYQTDYFTRLAQRKIRRYATTDQPFFLWQSYLAPHGGVTRGDWAGPNAPARHADRFRHARPPVLDSPQWNSDTSEKPLLRDESRFSRARRERVIGYYRSRLRALQAVDDGVQATVQTLRDSGELDNTLIIFTSDNGWMMGEHRYWGKDMPYEESLRVPFLMRGPTLPQGVRRERIGSLLDIAPTVAAATGATPGLTVDGRNLLPVAERGARSWRTMLIQGGPTEDFPGPGWRYRGVRTGRYTFVRYKGGELEMYDRWRDPNELDDVSNSPRYRRIRKVLRARLDRLAGCSGAACR